MGGRVVCVVQPNVKGYEVTPIVFLVPLRAAGVIGTCSLWTVQFCYTTTLVACRVFCLLYFNSSFTHWDLYFLRDKISCSRKFIATSGN